MELGGDNQSILLTPDMNAVGGLNARMCVNSNAEMCSFSENMRECRNAICDHSVNRGICLDNGTEEGPVRNVDCL